MKRNKRGLALIGLGTVLILSALLLFHHNRQEDRQAGQLAGEQLAGLQQLIRDRTDLSDDPGVGDTGTPGAGTAGTAVPGFGTGGAGLSEEDTPEQAEPAPLIIGGYAYIGFLSLPTLELELPVMAEWD